MSDQSNQAVPPPPASPIGRGGEQRRGTIGYWVGSLAMILGAGLLVLVIGVGVSRAADLVRFPTVVDSTGAVNVAHAGGQVIFVVGPSVAEVPPLQTPNVTVTDPQARTVPTGTYLSRRTNSSIDQTTGIRREAIAVATFHATTPGTYHLAANNLDDGLTLGVGRGAQLNGKTLGLGVFSGCLMFLAGLVMVIVTAVRRKPPAMPQTAYPPTGTWGSASPGPGSLVPPAYPRQPAYPPQPAQPMDVPPWAGEVPREKNVANDATTRAPRDEDFKPPDGWVP